MSTFPKAIGKTYQVGDLLAKGVFGKVHRGLNLKTGEVAAIKQFDKTAIGPAQLVGILKELDVLPKLTHPNLIRFIESYDIDQSLYFILEFVEGGSLRDAVKNFGTFPESLLVLYLTQILRGLQYLHDQTLAHRHIKGDNIMLTKDGMCKLTNSGAFPYTLAQIKANPFWSAPEVVDGAIATYRADIWAIGCCIIELLTGVPPFFELGAEGAVAKLTDDANPPFPSTTSPDLQDMLKQCFMKDPKKRISAANLLSHRCLTSIWGTSSSAVVSSSGSRKKSALRLSSIFSGRSLVKSKPKSPETVSPPSSSSTSPSTSPSSSPATKSFRSPLHARSPSMPTRSALMSFSVPKMSSGNGSLTEERKKASGGDRGSLMEEKTLEWYGSFEDDERNRKKKLNQLHSSSSSSNFRANPSPPPPSALASSLLIPSSSLERRSSAPNALKRFSSVSSYSSGKSSADRNKGAAEPAVSVGYRKTIDRLEGLLKTERDAKRQLALSRIQHKTDLDTLIRKLKSFRDIAEQQSTWKQQNTVLGDMDEMLKSLQDDYDRNEALLNELDLLEGWEDDSNSAAASRGLCRSVDSLH